MPLSTVELTSAIGSEIKIDLDTLLSGAEAKAIRCVLEERGVVLFRGLSLSDEQQITIARSLGEIVNQGSPDGIFKITPGSTERGGAAYLKGTFHWHIDGSTYDVPQLASLLRAVKLSDTGGQTEFANTYAAYDALPEAEKRAIDKFKVVHSLAGLSRAIGQDSARRSEELMAKMTPEQRAAVEAFARPKTHPLVWTHRSGRKSLVLGETASQIEGMSPEQSNATLERLQAWATQRQFIYRHEWEPDDMLIWDNTGTMHRVEPYPMDSGRLMHRITLAGEEPLA